MTEKTYPIELYVGDKVNWSCRLIKTAEEEAQYRGMGFVEYDDLPEPDPQPEEPQE